MSNDEKETPPEVPPMTYTTDPEERAQDLKEWRERIAEYYRQKEREAHSEQPTHLHRVR